MDNFPFISVLIVAYNYEKYLPKALNAIKSQTFKNFEVVIVNNGSTDNSEKVILDFINDNKNINIKYLKIQQNEGLPKGRNAALDNCCGKYIMFNDADDWMNNDCLQTFYDMAKKTDADRIIGNYSMVNEEDYQTYHNVEFEAHTSIWYASLLQGSIFKRDVFEKNNIRVPLDIYTDDIYMTVTFSIYLKTHAFLEKNIYNMLTHKTSMTAEKYKNKFSSGTTINYNNVFNIYKSAYDIVDEKSKQDIEYYCIKHYYHHFLQFGKKCNAKTMIKEYKTVREEFKSLFPNYIKNSNIHLFKNNDNAHGRKIVWVINKIDRCKILIPMLVAYGYITKLINFREQ